MCYFIRPVLITLFSLLALTSGAQEEKNGVVEIKGENGKLTAKETYEDGVLQGWAKYFYEDTAAVEYAGNYKEGEKNGRWLYYKYPDGEKTIYQYFTYKNGKLQGEFREQSGDSLIIGKYQNGKKDSTWLINRFKLSSGGDTLEIPLVKGRYKEGQKVGSWDYFKNGRKYKEGMYRNGEKDMLWKTYDVFTEKPEVMKETRYKKGVKDGKEVVYFELDKKEVPCDDENREKCFNYERKERYTEAYYHQGELNGDFLSKGVAGTILEKGEYDYGKKIGKWQERRPDEKQIVNITYFEGKKMGPVVYKDYDGTVRVKGNYVENKKNGKWVYFNEDGEKIREEVYDMDVLDGDVVLYNNSGVKQKVLEYDKGVLKSVLRYDFSGTEVSKSYKLNYDEPEKGWLEIKFMVSRGDSIIYSNYIYKPEGEIDADSFESDFKAAKGTENLYKDGMYEKMVDNKLQVSGLYTKDKKDGIWEYYYNDKITWQKIFENGKESGQKFINNNTKKPVEKDDYIVKYPNGNLKWEFQIKDGLRHGKSYYYNKKGEQVKKVKYKEGIPK